MANKKLSLDLKLTQAHETVNCSFTEALTEVGFPYRTLENYKATEK